MWNIQLSESMHDLCGPRTWREGALLAEQETPWD